LGKRKEKAKINNLKESRDLIVTIEVKFKEIKKTSKSFNPNCVD
jgi:hypothetical protein